ncbi:unnamed protein product, partial [Ectocarpus sp. 8 AP-2014]
MSRSQRHANGGGKGNADVAKYRDACPASRSDSEIVELVKKMGGDQAKIQSALEDWWQNDQGEWATATTKKKKQTAPQHHHHPRGGGGGYANGRGMDDRRGGRGGMADKMRG